MKKFQLSESIPGKLRGAKINFRGDDGNFGYCYVDNVVGDTYSMEFVSGMYDGENLDEEDFNTYAYEDFVINSKDLKKLISGKSIKNNDLVFEL